MSTICPSCHGSDFHSDEPNGNIVCVSCGTVLEESNIVNSVEFYETPAGTRYVVIYWRIQLISMQLEGRKKLNVISFFLNHNVILLTNTFLFIFIYPLCYLHIYTSIAVLYKVNMYQQHLLNHIVLLVLVMV